MGFLRSLFGSGRSEEDKGKSFDPESVKHLAKPAFALRKTDAETGSWLGGKPCMPAEFEWPTWKGQSLAFLCQIDCSEVPDGEPGPLLPDSGILYFFYDQDQGTWGFDPKEKDGWRVLYAEGDQECVERDWPEDMDSYSRFTKLALEFVRFDTYPDEFRPDHLIDGEAVDYGDGYFDWRHDQYESHACHQLFGYPRPIQNDTMEEECAMASQGIDVGDGKAYSDPGTAEVRATAKEWTLLLQLDSDDDMNVMWGDVGMVYFWIPASALAQKDFSRTWMVFQCS